MEPIDNESNPLDELSDKTKQAEDFSEGASNGVRFLNYLIDTILWYLLAVVIMLAIVFFSGNEELLDDKFFGYLITFVAMFSYYTFLEALTGQSIGKMITRTRVINQSGNKPELMQVAGRSLARVIPFDALSFLFASEGWHDSLSGTRVVKTEQKPGGELL